MTIAANRPLNGRRRAFPGRAIGWWLGELRGCRDDLRRVLATHSRSGVTVEAGERYWLLRRGQKPLGQLDLETADEAVLRRFFAPFDAQSVVVEIPPERALSRIVTFPAGAMAQLARILAFEISRHFPFPAERVYFQHRIVGPADAGGGVAVEIAAVPREIVDGIRATLAALGARPNVVAIITAGDAKPLYLPVGALAAVPATGVPHRRLFGIAAALTALAALVSWPLAQQAALGSLDRELAALKPRAEAVLRAGDAERRAGDLDAAIVALRGGRPPLVTALDALSRDVPDGAWLLSLSVSGRDVVLDGLAPSAAAVALALEKSHDVSGLVFRSPITREPSGLERFQLGATLNPIPGSTSGSTPGPVQGEARP